MLSPTVFASITQECNCTKNPVLEASMLNEWAAGNVFGRFGQATFEISRSQEVRSKYRCSVLTSARKT
ncbi:hypothetical protein BN2476_970024 [Paraburkholderia piptadeniae]|uniref:Uncharacterized protein n=1 Tax=Paraburkholderia piptadeniae TaxID=1701573 RepID=A0A1N7SU59_9BURK|nr:hypothetical protein BN2476_970024 [Paraburkholderia piptadeniae]